MRTRIFALILFSLVVTALAVTTFLFFTIRKERLELIDDQIRESAHALLNAQIGENEHLRYREIEKIISDELGPSRLGKIFVIRNSAGDVIFSNSPRYDIKNLLPHSPQWITLHTDKYWMRILNLSLPKIPDRTLQVGVILDPDFMSFKRFGQKAWVYISISVGVLFLISVLVTFFILSPLRRLSHHLKENTEKIEEMKPLSSLPENLARIGEREGFFRDELSALIEMIEKQSQRINGSQNLLKVWTTQLAHELKTPLTVVRMDIEAQQTHSQDKIWTNLNAEIDRMAHTLSEFLNWAQLEFSHTELNHQTQDLSQLVFQTAERLGLSDKVKFIRSSTTLVNAPPLLVEQLFLNILSNAKKYAPLQNPLEVELDGRSIEIRDDGPGLSAKVLSRLGEPFNREQSEQFLNVEDISHSTGLGLAICISIVRILKWKIEFINDNGLKIRLSF